MTTPHPRTTREIHNEPHHTQLPATPREREGHAMTDDLHDQLAVVRDQRDRAEAQLDTARAQLDQLALPARLTTALRNVLHGPYPSADRLDHLTAAALDIDLDRIRITLTGGELAMRLARPPVTDTEDTSTDTLAERLARVPDPCQDCIDGTHS